LHSEATRDRILWVRDGLMAGLFLLVMAWGVYTRARLAIAGSRSVLLAGGLAAMALLRHPVRTLSPLLALLLLEMVVLMGVLGPLARWANGSLEAAPSRGALVSLFLLGLAGLAWREVQRGARYHAAVVVSKATIRSLHHSDPWQSIGAPGGPQYPVNEDDEDRFGVSV